MRGSTCLRSETSGRVRRMGAAMSRCSLIIAMEPAAPVSAENDPDTMPNAAEKAMYWETVTPASTATR